MDRQGPLEPRWRQQQHQHQHRHCNPLHRQGLLEPRWCGYAPQQRQGVAWRQARRPVGSRAREGRRRVTRPVAGLRLQHVEVALSRCGRLQCKAHHHRHPREESRFGVGGLALGHCFRDVCGGLGRSSAKSQGFGAGFRRPPGARTSHPGPGHCGVGHRSAGQESLPLQWPAPPWTRIRSPPLPPWSPVAAWQGRLGGRRWKAPTARSTGLHHSHQCQRAWRGRQRQPMRR